MEFKFNLESLKIDDDIANNDEEMQIVQTLTTPKVKLHFYTKMVDFEKHRHKNIIIKPYRDEELGEQTVYAMSGHTIYLRNVKGTKVLLVSFGGLMGEFKLEENIEDVPDRWYLYVV